MNTNKKFMDPIFYHTMSIPKVVELLGSDRHGLTEAEANARLQQFGKNELQEGNSKTIWGMFLQQFADIMIIILLIAAVIAGLMGEWADTAIITVVVVINAVLGVLQESKAEKALASLKKMSSPYAKLKRNNEVQLHKSEEIVPGDIVVFEAGDYIPADIRLIETFNLKLEEAALTGESVPVDKTTETIEKPDIVIGDRKNMAYLGTSVTYGRGTGVVVATGMNTAVGEIAAHLNNIVMDETPLQKKLRELGKYLSIVVIIIAFIIFIAGIMQDRNIVEMLLTSVSLAVAAIPEGLPAIVTIVLALGVQRMAKRNAIIRKLSAVETLGSTEIICSDKTGTLTLNQMTVTEAYTSQQLLNDDEADHNHTLEIFMQAMALCNDTEMIRTDSHNITTLGDPTETALVHYTFAQGYHKDTLEEAMPRIGEIPFDSDRKLMTTIHRVNGISRILTKGAPDILLGKCNRIILNDQVHFISDRIIREINQANYSLAAKALRVLALAYKDSTAIIENPTPETVENDLIFLGLVGMIDPPRQEAKRAVKICQEAGIRPIMITGDHRNTATAIAMSLGIIKDAEEVLTGNDLDKIVEKDFLEQVEKYSVYARVSPEHKVRIVRAWQQKNRVVAMTGDGVNDAPALKAADIGVGMGITGTDVAKGVSDMVLSDDNFATIVLAVEEGRKIYANIRKAIQFLLSANTGEVLTLFIATMLNWPILFPIHILWINLVTDTFPALALGVEEGEADIMKQRPRHSSASIFAEGMGTAILYQGLLQALLTLGAYYSGMCLYNQEIAVTMAFATLGLIQLAHAFNVRSSTKSIMEIGVLTNKYLLGATLISTVLMVSVIVMPALNQIFRLTRLNINQWGIVIVFSLAIIPIVEIIKLLSRRNLS